MERYVFSVSAKKVLLLTTAIRDPFLLTDTFSLSYWYFLSDLIYVLSETLIQVEENQTHDQVECTDPAVTERLRVLQTGGGPLHQTENRKEVELECKNVARVTTLTYFQIKPEEKDMRPSGVYSTRM